MSEPNGFKVGGKLYPSKSIVTELAMMERIADLEENAKHTRIAYEVLCQTGERHALDAVMEKHAQQEGK